MGCLRGIPACVVAGHDDLRDAHGVYSQFAWSMV